MADYLLCEDCAGRFPEDSRIAVSRNRGGCHICAGLLSQKGQLVCQAIEKSSFFEWKTFSLSSSFPKKAFVNDEEIADLFAPEQITSLKNAVNAWAVAQIAAKTGRANNQRGADAAFGIDFRSGSASASPQPIHVFGRYSKKSRRHCQSRWHCFTCRGKGCPECKGSGRNYPSIEDELAAVLKPAFLADDAILHACGREDVDVMMLGEGRPFVMEFVSPKKREADLAALESALSQNHCVWARGLRFVGKRFQDALCSSHFEKEYVATVSASRPLSAADARKAEALSGETLSQLTPTRVLSRRSDMERRRRVFSIKAEPIPKGKLRLHILAEAGTYIKEMISSDGGRTKPSISSILGCAALCEELDVVAIRDSFLSTLSIE